MDIDKIVKAFEALSPSEQELFKNVIFNKIEHSDKSKNANLEINEFVSESRFSKGIYCSYCKSEKFVRNGKTKDGGQRYLCKECRKTFTATTNTLLSYTRKELSVWKRYIHCMMSGMSIRKSAQECGITLRCSFLWRHKILDALKEMQNGIKIDGIIEVDETFFRLSFKGNHKKSKNFKMPRSAHKRGGMIERGLGKDQVCVPSAVNRNGLSVSKVGNLGNTTVESISTVLKRHIVEDSVLCSDGHIAYKKLANEIHLREHIRIVGGRGKVRGYYSIARINAYHSALKTWMTRFKGVATKYLNNYLVWNNQVVWAKVTDDEKERTMLDFVVGVGIHTINKEVSCRNPVPVLN